MKSKLFLMLAVLTSVCGCARNEVGDITGRLLLDDKPLGGVSVLLWLENGQPGEGLGAIANNDGAFVIRTAHATTPIRTGAYRVVIQDPHNMAAMILDAKASLGAGKGTLPVRTPLKYCYRESSPLVVEIRAGENDLRTIELTPGS